VERADVGTVVADQPGLALEVVVPDATHRRFHERRHLLAGNLGSPGVVGVGVAEDAGTEMTRQEGVKMSPPASTHEEQGVLGAVGDDRQEAGGEKQPH
jgi:5-keto 4-deoxyuronate isomerase